MPYSFRKYSEPDIIGGIPFQPYPDQINYRWLEEYTDNAGLHNPNRTRPKETELPADWKGHNPISRRANLPHLLKPLTIAEKEDILAEAESKEDFHDYDKLLNPDVQGSVRYGCTCAVRFITGSDCTPHLAKGLDGKTLNEQTNEHWAWFIDIAASGSVCPRAWEKHHINMGNPLINGCNILLFNRAPSKAWVLAQMESDPEGTVAGRAVGDIVREGKCCKCMGLKVDEDNQLTESQKVKYQYQGESKPCLQPVVYRPENGQSAHGLLEPGNWYTKWDLEYFEGVTARDIWLPKVPITNEGGEITRGCTLKEWQQALADAQAAAAEAAEQGGEPTNITGQVPLWQLMEVDWENEESS